MNLYNTLTRKVEEFIPQIENEVKVYTCGPTVYDYSHVGHWFNYVRMDTLIRTLKTAGFNVKWVMNITDVGHLVSDADEGEDKLEKGARREGKTAWEIAEFYTEDFLDGMAKLNITSPTFITKATDHIKDQIQLIEILEAKGYTYIIDDGVYYDTTKFTSYADFARLDLDEQQPGARVEINRQKKSPYDFALWKFSPSDIKRDMEWESPWGKGFPGWHIECSAMSMKYLGATLDIHTGGIDHIPIHHTNEIAQSEAATGLRFANYWLHSNHVLVDGKKISKSLNNSIKLSDIEDKGYSPEILRLHILESQYRSQSKFSWDNLESAKNRLYDLKAMAVLRYQAPEKVYDSATFSLEDVSVELLKFMENDLNSPEALAFLSDVSSQLLAVLIERDALPHFINMLEAIDGLFGLSLMAEPDISQEHKDLIEERQEARKNNDWQRADEIRNLLKDAHILLKDDTRGVTIWSREM